jgi:hypothetical protein
MLRVSQMTGFERPRDVFPPNLTVWARYKASDMISVGDGNAVGTWTDKSRNGRDMTQATTARKPLLRTAASGLVGNTTAIEFLGDDTNPHNMAVPDMSALTTGFIATYVIADTDTDQPGFNTNVRRIWQMGSATDSYYKYTNTGPGIYETFGTTVRKTCGDTTPTSGVLTSWHSYMCSSASAAWTNWINNVQFFTTGTNTVGFPVAPLVGGYPGGSTTTRLGNKKIAEIIILSAVPSSTERAAIHQYFLDEYA